MKALSIRPRILFLRHRHQFGLWNRSMNSVVAWYRAAGSVCGLNAILDQAPHTFNNAGQDAFNRLPPLRIGALSLGSPSHIGQVLAITIYNQPKSQMFPADTRSDHSMKPFEVLAACLYGEFINYIRPVLRQNPIHLRFQQLRLSFSQPKISRSKFDLSA